MPPAFQRWLERRGPWSALVALAVFFEERCLRHRELDGHATPKWVLQSAARERLCAPSLSEVIAFAGDL